jgi:hypothetical protein
MKYDSFLYVKFLWVLRWTLFFYFNWPLLIIVLWILIKESFFWNKELTFSLANLFMGVFIGNYRILLKNNENLLKESEIWILLDISPSLLSQDLTLCLQNGVTSTWLSFCIILYYLWCLWFSSWSNVLLTALISTLAHFWV